MSVIIRLQNLPWSANALDIRNYFRGLSIPEGGVHIVGGELGDAFIAFSTDEDARQAMMLDCGKIKEIQVKLLLSSRSEMHKVIEAARQSVPVLSLPAAPAPPPPAPAVVAPPPGLGAFAAALGAPSTVALPGLGIPGIGNPNEIPQPAVIEPPDMAASDSPTPITTDSARDEDRPKKDKERRRSRSRSRDRDKKDRNRDKKDRRDRSRSRDRSRDRRRRDRDRSRSRDRDRRDRKRDRRDRSRSPRRSRDRRNAAEPNRSPSISQDATSNDATATGVLVDKQFNGPFYGNGAPQRPAAPMAAAAPLAMPQMPAALQPGAFAPNRFGAADPTMMDAFSRLQELGKKRNPNAFQGEMPNGGPRPRGGMARGGPHRREGRPSRFETDPQQDCCVVIRNAPTHTSYGDVRRFFPYAIDKHGIKMINDAGGRRTGTIYVRFTEPRSRPLALQRGRYELKGEQVLVEPLDDAEYDAGVDSFMPCRDDDRDDPRLLREPDEPQEMPRAPFTVLQLSELPLYVKEHDIIKMFNEYSLLSIQLSECRATRTKTALVQFVKPEDAQTALERKEPYMFGRRAAHVAPAPAPALQDAPVTLVDEDDRHRNAPPAQPEEPVAPRDPRQRPRARQDLEQQGPLPPVAPFMSPSFSALPYGASFGAPQFAIPQAAVVGDPRTAAWARPAFPAGAPVGPRARAPAPIMAHMDLDDEPQDCVLMKGLPHDVRDGTIIDFLASTGAVPVRIHLMLNTHDEPTGDCFCEFRSTQDARRATTKHGHDLDGCRVTVDLVARSLVEDALGGPKAEIDHSGGLLGDGPPVPMPQYYEPPMRGGGYPVRGGAGGPFRGRGFDRGGYDPRGRGFRRGGGFERGRGFEPRMRGRGFLRGRGRGGFGALGMEEGVEEEPDPTLEEFGAPGCVVCMDNVPFRASVDDILEFFGEFELSQDDIIRRFNERGQPTGDARVAFRTPFDAQRAVTTKNLQHLQERRVSLRLL